MYLASGLSALVGQPLLGLAKANSMVLRLKVNSDNVNDRPANEHGASGRYLALHAEEVETCNVVVAQASLTKTFTVK